MIKNPSLPNSGFALLMAIIVVSTVVSVGLTVLDITLKQLKLSTGSRDSEIAFHAANAGAECMRYWRGFRQDEFENGNDIADLRCFGDTATVWSRNIPGGAPALPSGAYRYSGSAEWVVDGRARCSEFTVLTINSGFAAGIPVNNIGTYVPGYPAVNKECPPGGRCTIISVQGYNTSCALRNSFGTVQREVLLEL